MEIPIPDKVKKLWDAWDIRVSIILSLFLQIYLSLFASLRQRRRNTLLLISIWSAYLLADWIAAVAIGQITKTQIDGCKPSSQNSHNLYAFWAAFLLSHLGGPDSITSFALEDNEFWLRHLFGLIAQIVAVAYSLFLTLPKNNLWIPTVFIFIVGTIKFSERTYALYLASVDRFGATVLPDPNPGLDYEEAVAIYSLTRCSGTTLLPKESEKTKITPDAVNYEDLKFALEDETEAAFELPALDDLKLLQFAYFLFQRFKGLIAGFVLSSQYRDSSRNFFLERNASEAFRLIEYELGFMYQVLHTKVEVIRCKIGYCFRIISFFFLIASLSIWISVFEKHNINYSKFDASLTYALIIGALGLGFISDLKLIFSDLTLIFLKHGQVKDLIAAVLATLKEQRWAGSISQYNLITHCLAERRIWIYNLAAYLHLGGFLDKLKILRFSYSIGLSEELKSFIFYELRRKSLANDNVKDAKEACSQRGEWALLKQNSKHSELLKWSISQFQYAESLLLWHLATEVCCRYKPETNDSKDEEEEEGEQACCTGKQAKSLSNGNNIIHEDFSIRVCKHLSDYIFYLLMDQPTLLAPVLGNWQLVFQDTCADAKRFFSKYSIQDHSKACNAILSVKTKIKPYVLKGNRCNSVFFDACILAQQLLSLKKFERWKVMDLVWVELLCYGAINCRPIVHAQQPSRGGELLTFTWLLMYHLGIGTQFHEQQDQHEDTQIRE